LNDDDEYLIAYEDNKKDRYVILYKFVIGNDHTEIVQLFYEELEQLCNGIDF
jgi:hypothetical protein